MACAAALGVAGAFALAACFVAGVGRDGDGARETTGDPVGLAQEIARLEQRVSLLQADLAAAWNLQESVVAAVGLDTIGVALRQAGVGGREPLPAAPPEADPEALRVQSLDVTLDQLLRQARLQRAGYETILDTLQERSARRGALPTIRPVDGGWLTSGFGMRADPFTGRPTFHEGLDFSVPMGTEVRATADGMVRDVVFERGFGHMVVLQHDARTTTRYAHLSQPLVARGQKISRGDVIALSGRSGRATSPHLHYEVLVNGRPVNPHSYIFDDYARRR